VAPLKGLWINAPAAPALRRSLAGVADAQIWTVIALVAAAQFAMFVELRRMGDRTTDAIGDLRKAMGDLRGEMGDLRGELRGEMGELRGELRGEMGELRGEVRALRSELKADIAGLRRDLHEHLALGH
jgi:hypothetical protein